MRELSWSDFAEAEGSTYLVGEGQERVSLTLEDASQLGESGTTAGSFRLEFRGPADPMLEQAIHRFEGPDDAFDIFIVPISRDANGTVYEAIFN